MAIAYKRTVEQLKKNLLAKLTDKIDSVILHGSAVRGEYRPWESDLDILVIGKSEDKSLERAISEITGEIDLENGTATSLVYFSERQFKRYLEWGSPFLESVVEEGVVIYDNGTFERVRKSIVKASGWMPQGSKNSPQGRRTLRFNFKGLLPWSFTGAKGL